MGMRALLGFIGTVLPARSHAIMSLRPDTITIGTGNEGFGVVNMWHCVWREVDSLGGIAADPSESPVTHFIPSPVFFAIAASQPRLFVLHRDEGSTQNLVGLLGLEPRTPAL